MKNRSKNKFMKIYYTKYENFLPIFLGILYFFTIKLNILGIFYCIFAITFAFYFCPVRVIFTGKDKQLETKDKIVDTILSCLFAVLISFSVVLFYIPEFQLIRNVVAVTGIILFVSFLYFVIKDEGKNSILCLLFNFFASWIIFGWG